MKRKQITDLGTAAGLNVGTGANQIVQLDGDAKLPAIDGSQLTGLSSGGGGGSRPSIYTPSSDTTIGNDTTISSGELERIYIVDASSAVTMTLPQITGDVGAGYKINIKRDGSNVVTITPNAADNIDGASDGVSITLDLDKAAFTLVCDGTNWQII